MPRRYKKKKKDSAVKKESTEKNITKRESVKSIDTARINKNLETIEGYKEDLQVSKQITENSLDTLRKQKEIFEKYIEEEEETLRKLTDMEDDLTLMESQLKTIKVGKNIRKINKTLIKDKPHRAKKSPKKD